MSDNTRGSKERKYKTHQMNEDPRLECSRNEEKEKSREAKHLKQLSMKDKISSYQHDYEHWINGKEFKAES